MAGADESAGAAVSPDRELLGHHHHGLLRRQRRDRARLPDDADRAGGLRDRRGGQRRVHQPRRGEHRDRAAQAQPQQHPGARRGHRPAPASPLGAADGGGAARDRGPASRPSLRDVLSQLHVEGADRPADHRLAHPHDPAAAGHHPGRAAGDQQRGRPADRDAGLDRPRQAGGAQPGAGRCTGGAAAQQLPRGGGPDQGRPDPDQPAGQHRPALGGGVLQPDRRGSRGRHRAPQRRGPGGAGRRRGDPGRQVQRPGERLPRRVAAGGRQRDRRPAPAGAGDGPPAAHAAQGHRDAAGVGRHPVHARRAQGDLQDAVRDHDDRGVRRVPLHGLGAHGPGAAGGDAGLPHRGRHRDVCLRLQPQPAHDPRDRAVGRSGGGRRDRGGRERRASRARGQVAPRRRR